MSRARGRRLGIWPMAVGDGREHAIAGGGPTADRSRRSTAPSPPPTAGVGVRYWTERPPPPVAVCVPFNSYTLPPEYCVHTASART